MTFFKNGGGMPQFNYQTLATQIASALRGPESSAERLPPDRLQQTSFRVAAPTGGQNGAILFQSQPLSFLMRSMVIDNPTGYILYHPETQTQIPSGVLGYGVPVQPAVDVLNLQILSGTNADSTLVIGVRCSERTVSPVASGGANSSGGGGGSATNTGATNSVSGVITVLSAVTTIVAARAQRWGVLVVNEDGTNPIRVASENTVTFSAGGVLLGAGGTLSLPTQKAVYGIAQSASVQVSFREDY